MKKFVLLLFVMILISLQFPLYTYSDSNGEIIINANYTLTQLISTYKAGGYDNNTTALVFGLAEYGLPILGTIFSLINVFIKKNISIITTIIGVFGVMLCGLNYFTILSLKEGFKTYGIAASYTVNFGFLMEFVLYILVITFSIVMIRVKED